MNRVDLAMAEHRGIEGETRAYVAGCGRAARRNARLSAEYAASIQRMPIRQRIIGWRRTGEPRGHSFLSWSPWMSSDGFRRRLHRMAAAGSVYAARQLALELVTDIREAA